MKLSVDASVVVKWFVAEPMGDEARLVLDHRVQLHAPELVLAEFANTIWKKARRKQIPDPGPYLGELAELPSIITLHPISHLAERAAQISFELDHPLYDCLYLACAELTDSDLITADRRFADKVAERLPECGIHYLGGPGVVDWLAKATTLPVIEQETMEALFEAHEKFLETKRSVIDGLFGESRKLRILSPQEQEIFLDSLPYRRLVDMVCKLSTEEFTALLALGWLGAGLYPDWPQSLDHAENMASRLEPRYAAGYGHYWRDGYERMTDECRCDLLPRSEQ